MGCSKVYTKYHIKINGICSVCGATLIPLHNEDKENKSDLFNIDRKGDHNEV